MSTIRATDETIDVRKIVVTVYRAPVAVPVVAAMGTMTDRPAVVVEVVDRDGAHGLGEVWCNFPTCGAEHRARLIETFVGPLLLERAFASPEDAFSYLSARAKRLALQSGEPGPLAQVIAGIDIALTDLVARRAALPVWRYLRTRRRPPAQVAEGGRGPNGPPAQVAEGGRGPSGPPAQVAGGGRGPSGPPARAAEGDSGPNRVAAALPAYASGINPDGAVQQALGAWDAGFRAFKLKIGFGRDRDIANLRALRDVLGTDVPIAVDANQAWGLDEASFMSRALAEDAPLWLEEPLPVDDPEEAWQELARTSPVPLAGGENLRGQDGFARATDRGALRVLQPDLAKWGGFTGCFEVARTARAAGQTYCPHYLGGGVGLLASAHLLAAVGGDGLLEVDCNPNPLRQGLAAPFPDLVEGRFVLDQAAGLGISPDPAVARFEMLRVVL